MAQVQQIKSLAAALAVAQQDADNKPGSRALIDELAMALARPEPQRLATLGHRPGSPAGPRPSLGERNSTSLTVSPDSADFDDEDDEQDLPMLVQGPKAQALGIRPASAPGSEGRAALYGFGAGLAVLIPIGIVWNLRTGDVANPQSGIETASLVPKVVQTELVSLPLTTASITRQPARPEAETSGADNTALPGATQQSSPETTAAPYEAALLEAEELIANGNIEAARKVLGAGANAEDPGALLALAETYDPNMLAAWSARNVNADAGIARALYGRALATGESKARQRLAALE